MTISAKEIKTVKSLGQKKFRDELGFFVVEGEKMVDEALSSGFNIEKIYRKEEIGEEAMSRISQLSSPSPVLDVVKKPAPFSESGIRSVIKGRGLFLGLDAIRDPGNLGTIIRIADWFGADAVFASADTADIFNPKTVQATMGALFRVAFHYTDLRFPANEILSQGGKVYGTFLDGKDLYSVDIETGENKAVMIIIGNEARGISEKMEALANEKLLIPSYPRNGGCGGESLNAAVATAVTLAEFRRRLSHK